MNFYGKVVFSIKLLTLRLNPFIEHDNMKTHSIPGAFPINFLFWWNWNRMKFHAPSMIWDFLISTVRKIPQKFNILKEKVFQVSPQEFQYYPTQTEKFPPTLFIEVFRALLYRHSQRVYRIALFFWQSTALGFSRNSNLRWISL